VNIKKRILNAFIALSFLGMEMYVAHTSTDMDFVNERNIAEEDNIPMPVIDGNQDQDDELVKEILMEMARKNMGWNNEKDEFRPSTSDAEYLSTLRENQNIVAVSSTPGNYYTIDLESDDWLVVPSSNGTNRLAEKYSDTDYYYDILTFQFCDEQLSDEEREQSISFGEFVSNNCLTPAGYCLPSDKKVECDEKTLETIREVYGDVFVKWVEENGLPLPYYHYEDIQKKNVKDNSAVKSLTD